MASEKEKDKLRERIGACLAVRDYDGARRCREHPHRGGRL